MATLIFSPSTCHLGTMPFPLPKESLSLLSSNLFLQYPCWPWIFPPFSRWYPRGVIPADDYMSYSSQRVSPPVLVSDIPLTGRFTIHLLNCHTCPKGLKSCKDGRLSLQNSRKSRSTRTHGPTTWCQWIKSGNGKDISIYLDLFFCTCFRLMIPSLLVCFFRLWSPCWTLSIGPSISNATRNLNQYPPFRKSLWLTTAHLFGLCITHWSLATHNTFDSLWPGPIMHFSSVYC